MKKVFCFLIFLFGNSSVIWGQNIDRQFEVGLSFGAVSSWQIIDFSADIATEPETDQMMYKVSGELRFRRRGSRKSRMWSSLGINFGTSSFSYDRSYILPSSSVVVRHDGVVTVLGTEPKLNFTLVEGRSYSWSAYVGVIYYPYASYRYQKYSIEGNDPFTADHRITNYSNINGELGSRFAYYFGMGNQRKFALNIALSFIQSFSDYEGSGYANAWYGGLGVVYVINGEVTPQNLLHL